MLGPFQIEIRPATYDVTRYRRQASRDERRGRRQGGPGREEEEGQRGTGKETRERGRRGEAEDKVAPEPTKKGKGEKDGRCRRAVAKGGGHVPDKVQCLDG